MRRSLAILAILATFVLGVSAFGQDTTHNRLLLKKSVQPSTAAPICSGRFVMFWDGSSVRQSTDGCRTWSGFAGGVSLSVTNTWTAAQTFTAPYDSDGDTVTPGAYVKILTTTNPDGDAFRVYKTNGTLFSVHGDGSIQAAGDIVTTTNVSGAKFTGLLITAGTAPTLTGCGTGATRAGNSNVGTWTIGSTPTGTCGITFATPFAHAPHCTIYSVDSASVLAPTLVSTTGFSLDSQDLGPTFTYPSGTFTYACFAY